MQDSQFDIGQRPIQENKLSIPIDDLIRWLTILDLTIAVPYLSACKGPDDIHGETEPVKETQRTYLVRTYGPESFNDRAVREQIKPYEDDNGATIVPKLLFRFQVHVPSDIRGEPRGTHSNITLTVAVPISPHYLVYDQIEQLTYAAGLDTDGFPFYFPGGPDMDGMQDGQIVGLEGNKINEFVRVVLNGRVLIENHIDEYGQQKPFSPGDTLLIYYPVFVPKTFGPLEGLVSVQEVWARVRDNPGADDPVHVGSFGVEYVYGEDGIWHFRCVKVIDGIMGIGGLPFEEAPKRRYDCEYCTFVEPLCPGDGDNYQGEVFVSPQTVLDYEPPAGFDLGARGFE